MTTMGPPVTINWRTKTETETETETENGRIRDAHASIRICFDVKVIHQYHRECVEEMTSC